MKVLITGGTGALGSLLTQRLDGRADVRVLSRRPGERAGHLRGDLDTGEGVAEAVRGVDVIAHCASAADHRHPERDIAQAQRLLDAVSSARPHLLYISIVGVDRVRLGYYRAKLATERLVAGSGLPYTILRTTQFHDFALMLLMLLTRGPVGLVPRAMRVQPVDTGEVAGRMAELALGPPAGRVPDLGGPRVEDVADLARRYLALTGRRRPLLRVPLPGRAASDFRAGRHLLGPDGTPGERTFEDYLRDRLRPDGTMAPPYDLSARRRG